jgi:L-lactate dehydrogenase complex protein LldF
MSFLGMGLSSRRKLAKDGLAEFDTLRDEARDIKDHVLENLDVYLQRFEEQVIASGGYVHWASNADAARDIVLAICQGVDARTITKSKSMVTEEIELVPHLEAHGISAVETDLGEYIIQLRNEKPSHIIAPAIHLNKDQISETFFEHHSKVGFNEKLTERSDLVAQARQILREKFLAADVGISGANFLVADSGTVVLVTNEGNAELVTGLPDTHIAITGIEKIVPTLEDASTFIRLLARSAIGMEISSYTSFITGPGRSDDRDGPTNFHVVLVDNGRSDMLGTEFQDMLRCIRCSACLNHCPVYLSVGGHAYGSVYSGPMGAVLTPQLASIDKAGHLPNASTFCGRCEEVCPVRIPLPKMMRHWREKEFEKHLSPPALRRGIILWGWLNRHPPLYRMAIALAARFMHLFGRTRGVWMTKLPGIASGWTRHRDMKVSEGRSFLSQWKKRS